MSFVSKDPQRGKSSGVKKRGGVMCAKTGGGGEVSEKNGIV